MCRRSKHTGLTVCDASGIVPAITEPSPIAAVPAEPRRTQEERRAHTRAALLEATLGCLVEHGYAATTTTRVAERAGVSRGAQVHHFHTKAELVGGAIEHVARRRAAELLRDVRALDAPSVEDALDLLWRSHSGSLFHAAIELWVAARTDPEVRAALVHVEDQTSRDVLAFCRRIFGPAAEQPGFEDALATSLVAIRGLALTSILRADDAVTELEWRRCRERLACLFTASPPAHKEH